MPTASPLVARLKSAMEARDLNARELAGQAGVGASFVYDVLKGKSKSPTVDKLAAIAAVLGTTAAELMGEAGDGMVRIAPLQGKSLAAPWRFHAAWIQDALGTSPAQLRAFELRDDAMTPALAEGDMLLVDIDQTSPESGRLYAVEDALGVTVRRAETKGKKRMFVSENPAYGTRETRAFTTLGRVVWSARRL